MKNKTSNLKQIAKKILCITGALLVALILLALIVLFWYYPHYRSEKETVEITAQSGQETGEITMMSYNLRCLTPLDLGQKSWFYRADLVIDDIVEQAPGIIGFQEATKWQYQYLVDCLAGYDSVITYRDESVIAEGCPIFYNTQLYTLVDKGSFWLSETPDVMSKDWGAAHYRICSYVILTDKASEQDFVVFNTHLDHVSDEARIGGIQVVLDKIAQFGSLPAVIMGDFNAKEGSKTYESVTENFLDARYAAEYVSENITENAAEGYTYQNWGNLENSRRIDFFMLSKSGFVVHSYQVLSGIRDGVYTSDHCPIVLQVTLE